MNMAGEWDERTGIEEVDDALYPAGGRRRRLSSLMDYKGPGTPLPTDTNPSKPVPLPTDTRPAITEDLESGRLAHRISDDQQTGNRSGGPAGGYQDPGQGRLSELMKQREALNAPAAKPSLLQTLGRLAAQIAPVALASKFGGMGGTVGAEKGVEEGIQRRHQVEDLNKRNQREDRVRLDEQIEAENRGMEQRTFQHGEDEARIAEQERGLNERARMAQEMETGRNERLAKTLETRQGMQQAGFGQQTAMEDLKQTGREELEDQKQTGRMALQRAKSEAQAAIAKWKHEHPTEQKIPPALAKTFATYETSQSRMDVMEQSYQAAIRDPGNSQAMINLLASHLGMTMGLQPGARMNQAIIQEAMKSGYLDERIEAHFGPDGYLTGVVLTPRQMKQMMELAQNRLMEDARVVKETEGYFGVQGHTPVKPRVPGSNDGKGAGGGAGGPGAPNASSTAPKTAEEYLKRRQAKAATSAGQQ